MSDSSPTPWTIRGIPEDVRKLASDAATRAGIPLGPWVSHAIRQTAASDRGGLTGEVVSDRASDRAAGTGGPEVVAMLYAGLAQIAEKKGCGGTATRTRALIEQHLIGMGLAPQAPKKPPPKRIAADQ